MGVREREGEPTVSVGFELHAVKHGSAGEITRVGVAILTCGWFHRLVDAFEASHHAAMTHVAWFNTFNEFAGIDEPGELSDEEQAVMANREPMIEECAEPARVKRGIAELLAAARSGTLEIPEGVWDYMGVDRPLRDAELADAIEEELSEWLALCDDAEAQGARVVVLCG